MNSDNELERKQALHDYLGLFSDLEEIEDSKYRQHSFNIGGEEYLVVTDSEQGSENSLKFEGTQDISHSNSDEVRTYSIYRY